jgi:hypothetical protein
MYSIKYNDRVYKTDKNLKIFEILQIDEKKETEIELVLFENYLPSILENVCNCDAEYYEAVAYFGDIPLMEKIETKWQSIIYSEYNKKRILECEKFIEENLDLTPFLI